MELSMVGSVEPLRMSGNDHSLIWRYMDMPKFMSMLSTGRLRFTQAATFRDDPWEGFCEVNVPEIPPELWEQSPAFALYHMATKYSAEEYRSAPQRLYVNSWCRWRESMSMWDLYGAGARGVAITSTPAKYEAAVERGETRKDQWAFGVVRYHKDLASADAVVRDLTQHALQSGALWQSMLELVLQKRCGFEAENEWRAALYQPREQLGTGVDMACDLSQLIDEIYVGPRAEPFVQAAVTAVAEKFGLQKPVKHSSLLQGPKRQG